MRNRSLVQATRILIKWFHYNNQPFCSLLRAGGIHLALYKPSQPETEGFFALSEGSGDSPPAANPWSLLEGWQQKAVQLRSTQPRPQLQELREPTKAGVGPTSQEAGFTSDWLVEAREDNTTGVETTYMAGDEKGDSTPPRAQFPLGTWTHLRPRSRRR